MKNTAKRLLSCVVVLLMVLSVSAPAFAMERGQIDEPLESRTSGSYDLSVIRNGKTFAIENEKVNDEIAADQIVSIMVELEDAPAMKVNNDVKSASSYQASLLDKQEIAVKQIREELNVDVDVIYNYTLLFNGFAFDGEYRLVEELNKMDGINAFVAPEWETPEPSLSSSVDMVGGIEAWDLDYTGEGRIIAIIDTGMKVDHPAFSNDPDAETVRFTKNDIADIIAEGELQGTGMAKMNADDVYYSAKIPFRWNYVKKTNNVEHTTVGSDHGTHVAGIAAGNGGDIEGVAKNAQLAAMNVFNDGGGAGWVAIVAALEDCVVLGVDAANMSLGSACGFTEYYVDSYAEVFENLVNAGVNLSVSAGNDYSTALRNAWNPSGVGYALAANPDYGVVGSPSTWPESLSIASVDNTHIQAYCITNVANGEEYSYTENGSNVASLIDTFGGQTLDYVAVPGFGTVEDFQDVNVEGKAALISRGSTTFVEKAQNAQANGAVAVIIYNNTDGIMNMATDPSITIPFICIQQAAGLELAEAGEGQISVNVDASVFDNPTASLPSDFSSFGTTSDLRIKPEIAAPGGSIYSSTDPSISNTLYDTWNGTSMSAPHVAGGMAIVTSYVEDMFPNATVAERQNLVDAILMSTANPVNDEDGSFAAVRKQGAGLMDLADAVTTTSYITVPGNVRPKLELGDDPEKTGKFEMTFEVNNFGETALSYEIVPSVLIDDLVAIARDNEGNPVIAYSQTSYDITEKCTINAPETVMVPAGETVEVNVTVELNDDIKEYMDAYYTNGAYVEGFIELYAQEGSKGDVNGDGNIDMEDVLAVMRHALQVEMLENPGIADLNDDGVANMADALLILRYTLSTSEDFELGTIEAGADLNVPFLGFYGDWNYSPVLDYGFYYDDYSYGSNPVNNLIGAKYGDVVLGLGINPYVETEDMSYYMDDRNAVSPNGDGVLDTANFIRLGVLRNASEAGYELLDSEGNLIDRLARQIGVRKSFYYSGGSVYTNLGTDMPMVSWSAMPYVGQDLTLRAYAYLSNDGSVTTDAFTPDANAFCEWNIPVFVDVEAPTAEIISLEDGVLEVDVYDNHYAAYVGVWTGEAEDGAVTLGECIGEEGIFEDGRGADHQATFEGVEDGMLICVGDYAANEAVYQLINGELVLVADMWSHAEPMEAPNLVMTSYAYGVTYGDEPNGYIWLTYPSDFDINKTNVNAIDDPGKYLAADAAGDKVYAVTSDNVLVSYTIDASGNWGDYTEIGALDLSSNVNEMAYNPANGKLYVVAGFTKLYEVDTKTAALSEPVSIQNAAAALDFADDGTCYVVDLSGYFATLDPETGMEINDDIGHNYGIEVYDGQYAPYTQCGGVIGNYFVWVALDTNISDFNEIKILALDLETGDCADLGAPVVHANSDIYFWPRGMFGYEIEKPKPVKSSIDPVDFYENFEGAFEWETIDKDGDGDTWTTNYFEENEDGNPTYFDGAKCAVSYSWNNVVLYPDNWMISPEIEIGDGEKYLNFFTSSLNSSTGDIYEHFAVYVIPEGMDVEEGIVVYETTMDTNNLKEHLVSLEGFDGETVRIAFRHFNCHDQYTLIVDAVGIGDLIAE